MERAGQQRQAGKTRSRRRLADRMTAWPRPAKPQIDADTERATRAFRCHPGGRYAHAGGKPNS